MLDTAPTLLCSEEPRGGRVLVELSKLEQRYNAVVGVIRDGCSVKEGAEAYGVSHQDTHLSDSDRGATILRRGVKLQQRRHRSASSVANTNSLLVYLTG